MNSETNKIKAQSLLDDTVNNINNEFMNLYNCGQASFYAVFETCLQKGLTMVQTMEILDSSVESWNDETLLFKEKIKRELI